ncbi:MULTISPECIES: FecCD family ABC transporter permease [Dictyoglomus]|jgi:iron complex transport system permease protein|uniref:Transport system permease protein n=1 Tax=Dictyoglomus turgidum (strain DSM 6724 / Z-1310) TaxID=515635 RepID=B8E0W8_DICTD|nr:MULTISPECIES: iron ABC transporter permease [Dictyoglomus]ACK42705.1 transport system permease protein [Dictyoglomus turgidum DSM 6724]HBU30764.1 iron ABC transporter permease [Dictyoglomus sp.]
MRLKIALLSAVLIILTFLSVYVGGVKKLSDEVRGKIIWNIRLPRTLLSTLVGGNLGLAGAILQSLFHNPLAEPHIIGLSSGALLGATLYFILSGSTWDIDPLLTPLFAITGSVIVLILLILLNKKFQSSYTLILLGISLNSLLSSVIALILFLKQKTFQGVYFWLLGGFNGKTWNHFCLLASYSNIGILWAFLWRNKFNLLFLSEEEMYSLGFSLRKYQPLIIILLSFLISPSVAVSGSIGFVGLIAPHLMRVWETSDYKWLIPSSFLAGANLLLASDILSRILFYPTEIPVGIITSFLGVPFFMYLLIRKK